MMRGKITDTDLQHAIGYSSMAMTKRYLHWIPEHIKRFTSTQKEVFSPLLLYETIEKNHTI